MKTSSWVIVEKSTGKAVFETFEKVTANSINADKYKAVAIMEYLKYINTQLK